MTWKTYLLITVISLVLVFALAGFQTAPGYMDAEYYYSMALRIANKQGLSEPFVWNYLNPVNQLPHPGFTYWMPLPAFLSAVGIWISGVKSFGAAKSVHLLLGALLPALTMRIASRLTESKPEALLAGSLALVPAFYNVFLGTTDSFAIVMFLGGTLFLLLLEDDHPWKYVGLGGIAALMHLARADGMVWILAGFYAAIRAENRKVQFLLWVGAGYLILMGPWYARNLMVLGRLMPPGVSKTFWLLTYDDLFVYSSSSLTFSSWISQGLPAILSKILKAGTTNLKSAVLIQGQVILSPFLLLGLWIKRKDRDLQAVCLVWLAIFLLMTFIFPFAGMRGGFFHSGASFQPLFWSMASIGFFGMIDWGVTRRGWQQEKAGMVFGLALVILVAVASFFIFYDRVIGEDLDQPLWAQSYQAAEGIDLFLDGLGLSEGDLVLINNPPGLYAAGERPSIAIPSDGVEAVLQAGRDFGAQYLVLEENHPPALSEIYLDPSSDSRFTYLGSVGEALIFEISLTGEIHD